MLYLYISLAVVAAIIISLIIYYFAAGIGELRRAKKEWQIEGLSEGFVPQGITYARSINKFLISGYMSKGQPSRVYVIDAATKRTEKFVIFERLSGVVYKGHAGGIAVHGGYGFISSEGMVYRFSLSALCQSVLSQKIRFDYEFKTETNADFCMVTNGMLWVGEFYKMGKFLTDTTHHILLEGGKQQSAVAFGFRLTENAVPASLPERALSLPDMVQGMEFCSGKLYLSSSYALSKSHLYEYDNVFYKSANAFMVFKDRRVPLWVLENRYLRKSYTLPSMCEGIVCVDGRLYIIFESAAKKYRPFMRTRVKHVYSIKLG